MKRASLHLNHIQKGHLLGSKEQRNCPNNKIPVDLLEATAFRVKVDTSKTFSRTTYIHV